jgi:nucleotide-binding universal stress UspA family protein
MLKKILVAIATPGSNHYVFDQALMLAKSMKAHLGLIHVTDPDEAGDDLPAYLDYMEPYLGFTEKIREAWKSSFGLGQPSILPARPSIAPSH